MDQKKKVIYSFLALALAALSVWAVLFGTGVSFSELLEDYKEASPGYMLLAALASLGYIFFESEAIGSILRQIDYPRSHKNTFFYSASDIYFSAITPSATGGQPAAAFFMMKDGIPGPVVTAVLLLDLALHTIAILTLGVLCLLFGGRIFWNFSLFGKLCIGLGFFCLSCLAAFFLLLLWKRIILEKIIHYGLIFLKKIHILKDTKKWKEKADRLMADYGRCADLLGGNKKLLLRTYLWNLLQRASQITVAALVYLALGTDKARTAAVWVTQTFVTIGANCAPIPGAMGISDYLMVNGFHALMSREAAAKLELLSRGISFYCCIAVSGLVVAFGCLILRHQKKKRKNINADLRV